MMIILQIVAGLFLIVVVFNVTPFLVLWIRAKFYRLPIGLWEATQIGLRAGRVRSGQLLNVWREAIRVGLPDFPWRLLDEFHEQHGLRGLRNVVAAKGMANQSGVELNWKDSVEIEHAGGDSLELIRRAIENKLSRLTFVEARDLLAEEGRALEPTPWTFNIDGRTISVTRKDLLNPDGSA